MRIYCDELSRTNECDFKKNNEWISSGTSTIRIAKKTTCGSSRQKHPLVSGDLL